MKLHTFDELYKASEENHLLGGNGLNSKYEINTGYGNILDEMENKDDFCYDDKFRTDFTGCGYNLEKMIMKYCKFGRKTIKSDFYKALLYIVGDAEKNKVEDAEFITKFKTIYTLNFDPFLYKLILLLNKEELKVARRVRFLEEGHSIKDIEEQLKSRRFGTGKSFAELTQSEKGILIAAHFVGQQKLVAKREYLHLTGEEVDPSMIKHNEYRDGFLKEDGVMVWDEKNPQEFTQLHGGLHITKVGKQIRKVSGGTALTLREKISEVVCSSEGVDCVLGPSWEDKLNQIENNDYLRTGYDRFGEIKGNLFVVGVDFLNAMLDRHIWKQINKNDGLKSVNISIYNGDIANPEEIEAKLNQAMAMKEKVLKDRHERFFDADSI